jgi:hypothetical protein
MNKDSMVYCGQSSFDRLLLPKKACGGGCPAQLVSLKKQEHYDDLTRYAIPKAMFAGFPAPYKVCAGKISSHA